MPALFRVLHSTESPYRKEESTKKKRNDEKTHEGFELLLSFATAVVQEKPSPGLGAACRLNAGLMRGHDAFIGGILGVEILGRRLGHTKPVQLTSSAKDSTPSPGQTPSLGPDPQREKKNKKFIGELFSRSQEFAGSNHYSKKTFSHWLEATPPRPNQSTANIRMLP